MQKPNELIELKKDDGGQLELLTVMKNLRNSESSTCMMIIAKIPGGWRSWLVLLFAAMSLGSANKFEMPQQLNIDMHTSISTMPISKKHSD